MNGGFRVMDPSRQTRLLRVPTITRVSVVARGTAICGWFAVRTFQEIRQRCSSPLSIHVAGV
jgi:hypothetical protein